MPRKAKGPRLYLQPARRAQGDRGPEDAVWVIRHGSLKRSTGYPESHRAQAEMKLSEYVAGAQEQRTYFVYFVTAKADGFPVKIGITETRLMRFQTLQIALPYEVEVLAIVPTADPLLERRLHRRFKAARLRGEWFERTPEILATIEELCREAGAA